MAMHTELWFPTVIWSAMIHMIDNNELKRWAYEKQKQDKGRVISNYNGYQSNDILPGECIEVDKLVDYLNTEVNACAKQVGLPQIELYNIWLNINPKGAYNQLHHHMDSILSGVYYIDATPEQGNIQFERTDGAEYHIPVEVPQPATYYTSTRATYAAKTGALYIFPGWLKHQVEGNKTSNDRLSISFNYGEKQ